jgi:glycosyltransferase involved in cell wall biosynthesis
VLDHENLDNFRLKLFCKFNFKCVKSVHEQRFQKLILKITHLSHTDKIGGATNFALRIIESGNSIGQENIFLVSSRQGRLDNTFVVSQFGNKYYNFFRAKLSQSLDLKIGKLEKTQNSILKSTNFFGCINAKKLNQLDSDIVHFHFMNGGLISIREIGKIKKPILWTLPDMWAVLGTEHYLTESDINRLELGYRKSNRNESDKGLDLSRIIWNLKIKNFSNLNLVAPSQWLANQIEKSPIFKNKIIEVIPPPIDTQMFKPTNRNEYRNRLGLDRKNFVIGFLGGLEIRKGWNLVHELILDGRKNESWKFILGGVGQSKYPELPNNVVKVGKIKDHVDLLDFYSSLDVLLVPSFQEAYGLVAQEAQSCGVPVIVFSNTGCADIVSDSITGFIVTKRSSLELAKALSNLQHSSEEKQKEMKINARKKAENLWNYNTIAERYKDKYEQIIAHSVETTT